jgi:hypothetical protein
MSACQTIRLPAVPQVRVGLDHPGFLNLETSNPPRIKNFFLITTPGSVIAITTLLLDVIPHAKAPVSSESSHTGMTRNHTTDAARHTCVIKNHTGVIHDHTVVIVDHTVVVWDHTVMIHDITCVITDHTDVTGNHTSRIRNHTCVITSHAFMTENVTWLSAKASAASDSRPAS